MKLSQFTLYKNTNFTDMQNTLHFNSNTERDNWFSSYFTDNNVITFSHPFNFRYDRGTLKVPMDMNELQGFNYCQFIDPSGFSAIKHVLESGTDEIATFTFNCATNTSEAVISEQLKAELIQFVPQGSSVSNGAITISNDGTNMKLINSAGSQNVNQQGTFTLVKAEGGGSVS